MRAKWIAPFLCVALGPYTWAEEPAKLRVVTYNVQFLPGVAGGANKRPNAEYRAKRIADEMSKFDIVGLQETFNKPHRDIIVEGVKSAWEGTLNSVVAPQPEGFFANGGTLILTRMPIIDTGSVVYKHFSSPKDFGLRADGFAAKGCIHARVARSETAKDKIIDVFVTHLEARADELRPLQYQELAEFIKAKSDPGHPAMLMGDLNTNGNPEFRDKPDSQYALLMKSLNGARPNAPFVDVWPALMGNALGGTNEQESADIGKRIDYILISNPESAAHPLKPIAIRVNLHQDPQVVALSDHNAVEAEFEW